MSIPFFTLRMGSRSTHQHITGTAHWQGRSGAAFHHTILSLGFFACSLFCLLHAQPPSHFRHFTVRDGLSDNRVYCMVRDHQGMLWAGTANGLNRFDGYTFRQYLPQEIPGSHTITGEVVYALLCGTDGRIWIGTGNGLSCMNPETGKFSHWNHTGTGNGSLPNPTVLSMIFDRKQRLWLSCDNQGLVRYSEAEQTFIVYPLRAYALRVIPSLKPDFHLQVTGIFEKSEHEFWLESNAGYFSFNTETESFSYYDVPERFPEFVPEAAACKQFSFLRSWENDVLCYDGCEKKWSRLMLPLGKEYTGGRRLVSSVMPWKNGHVVTAREGLFWMPPTSAPLIAIQTPPEGQQKIPSGQLNCSYTDKSGALWVGGENGLWLAEPASQHFLYQQLKQPESRDFYNTFTAFLETEDGYFLALDFYFHRLHIFRNGKQVQVLDLPPYANLLYQDQKNQIWTGGGNELFQLDIPAFRLRKFPAGLKSAEEKGYFTVMAEDPEGNYWFGHTVAGILRLNSNTGDWQIPGEESGFYSNHVSSILSDSGRNCMWIATPDYGLYRYDFSSGKFHLFQHNPADTSGGIPAWMATDICLDSRGRPVISTDPGGIAIYEKGDPGNAVFKVTGRHQGLPSGRVISLIKDRSGRIWAGTLSGLACFIPEENRVLRFGTEDGLLQEFMDLPLWMNSKGEILNGTVYGVQKWNPDSLVRERDSATLYFSSFRIFDRDISDSLQLSGTGEITLTWKQNFFSFSLISSDIAMAEKRTFKWKLHGFDEGWKGMGSGRNSVPEGSYTNVPSGEYLLEVRSGLAGNPESDVLKLKIRIIPPFWQTWWFRIAGVLLAAGILMVVFRRRVKHIRREEKLQADFKHRIAQTEMAALRAQMNPHFVFNCLNSINRYIMVNQPEQASAYLSKFAKLIRLILDNSRSDTVLLSRELEALQLYVEIERMRFDEKFDFRLNVAPDVSAGSAEIPPLLIQPYVENAIWHGLMHKRGPGLLTVSVRKENNRLKIEITDNGIGRKKALEYKSKTAGTAKSHGTRMTAERISIINQLYNTHATVSTTDLENENGEPEGTRVTLIL